MTIYDHLRDCVTPINVHAILGCGVKIQKKTVRAKNRYGKKVHYMRYSRM